MEGSGANLTALVWPWVVGAGGGGVLKIGVDSVLGEGLCGLGGRGGGRGGRSEVHCVTTALTAMVGGRGDDGGLTVCDFRD